MKILMIIPAYNEEGNIVNTVSQIKKYKKIDLDYVVINDGSRDNTKNILIDNNINYVDLSNNLGIGAAVQTGYKYAYYNDYDIAIQFDGDGQHDVNYVDRLIDSIVKEKCDMVVGSRFVGNESGFKSTRSRRIGINILSFIIKLFTKQTLKDVTSGYRAVNKELIKRFALDYVFEYPEPITNLDVIKCGYKVKEVAVNMKEREHGVSSINFKKSIYYMFNVGLAMLILGIGGSKK